MLSEDDKASSDESSRLTDAEIIDNILTMIIAGQKNLLYSILSISLEVPLPYKFMVKILENFSMNIIFLNATTSAVTFGRKCAGQDTTASAITWMIKFLDENQDVLEKLRVSENNCR